HLPVGGRLGVAAVAPRTATPAAPTATLAVRLAVLGLRRLLVGRGLAAARGSRRLSAMATGISRLLRLGGRLEDRLRRLEGRGRTGPAAGSPPAALGGRGLVVAGLPCRWRALGRRGTSRRAAGWRVYLWRASATALLTAGLCIVQLGLEHPGDLPSGSRAPR